METRTAAVAGERDGSSPWSTPICLAVLVAALAVHVGMVAFLRTINGFWWDEYYSLWASDPGTDFRTAFLERIWPDSNPPLYFTLLRIVRESGLAPLPAVLVLNTAATALAVAVVLRDGWRSERRSAAVLAVAGVLASAPVLAFAAEARAYPIAFMEVLVAAWFGFRSTTDDGPPAPMAGMAALGVLAGLTHVFAALACCSVAAGAIVAGGWWSRRTLAPMMTLGAAAAATTVVWLAANWGASNRVDWIRFDLFAFKVAIGKSFGLMFGWWVLAVLAAGLLAAAAGTPGLRRIAVFAGCAAVLFVAIPTAASFVKPIVTARYLLAIGPLFPLALAALATAPPAPRTMRLAALGLMAAVVAAGLPAAYAYVLDKSAWRGGPIVAARAGTCGPGSIAVNGPEVAVQDPAWLYGLADASGLPEATFTIAGRGRAPANDPGCGVLGWAEHVYAPDLPAAAVLRLVGLERDPATVEIVRTAFGYVVLPKSG